MFLINLNADIIDAWGEPSYLGNIRINNWSENFYSPSTFWSRKDYLMSWSKEIEKLLNEKNYNAKLITSVHQLETMNFLKAWILYPVNNRIYIQEQIFFMDDFKKPFKLKYFFDLELKRAIVNDEGEKISEWESNISDLTRYLRLLQKKLE